ncbi:MAG: hypothetical protein JSV56_11940, partial [Methanomassiliicoccales archaeon]
MRKAHFLLIGMLFISCITVNIFAPIGAEEPHGTRSPGPDVSVTSQTANQTGVPTDNISYDFTVRNTGDELDNFTVSAYSEHGWLVNWT